MIGISFDPAKMTVFSSSVRSDGRDCVFEKQQFQGGNGIIRAGRTKL